MPAASSTTSLPARAVVLETMTAIHNNHNNHDTGTGRRPSLAPTQPPTPDIDAVVERYVAWKGQNPLPPSNASGKKPTVHEPHHRSPRLSLLAFVSVLSTPRLWPPSTSHPSASHTTTLARPTQRFRSGLTDHYRSARALTVACLPSRYTRTRWRGNAIPTGGSGCPAQLFHWKPCARMIPTHVRLGNGKEGEDSRRKGEVTREDVGQEEQAGASGIMLRRMRATCSLPAANPDLRSPPGFQVAVSHKGVASARLVSVPDIPTPPTPPSPIHDIRRIDPAPSRQIQAAEMICEKRGKIGV
ncbi:hypothetical protein GGR56DRAFT_527698 [Xylariaceae sp. FL0804]|nr:hypothetical protein GGR56DRAFT_527698 [Xylariaceae sp. FL0804]